MPSSRRLVFLWQRDGSFANAGLSNADFSVRGTSSYNWNYLFQGKHYDGTVGLYDSRERVYSPTLMRPLQADPLGVGPDNNVYRWEINRPTTLTDPTGLHPPSNPACQKLLREIYGLITEIQRREAELKEDKLNLPETCPGDRAKPSLSRRGHRGIISQKKKILQEKIAKYKAMCSDPEPHPRVPPVPVVQPQTNPDTNPSIDVNKIIIATNETLIVANGVVFILIIVELATGPFGWIALAGTAAVGGGMLLNPSPTYAGDSSLNGQMPRPSAPQPEPAIPPKPVFPQRGLPLLTVA